jgi:hypothetical protein
MILTLGKQPRASACLIIEYVIDIVAWLATTAAAVATMNDGHRTESAPNTHVNVHSHRHGKSRIPLSDITWKGIIESMDDTISVLSYIGSLASILQKKAWKHNHGESNLQTKM